jgi:myo-inositol-1(or 4)-monophosphatase
MPNGNLAVSAARAIASAIRPLISDTAQIPELGVITSYKGNGHTAHAIDLKAEEILFEALKRADYDGTVYSEESGLVRMGNQPRIIICDPYCNTTLTFRGFRESAVAVYEFTREGNFTAGAIADLQIPRIVWAEASSGGAFFTPTDRSGDSGAEEIRDAARARCSEVKRVQDAFITISLLKRNRRESLPTTLLSEASMVTTIDGAIVAARLALGEIDGFVDARIGQPSYEAIAYFLVYKAGGIVTDSTGAPVDFAAIVTALWEGEVTRQTIIAAGNRLLHDEILGKVSDDLLSLGQSIVVSSPRRKH